jgi:hypothetical protein
MRTGDGDWGRARAGVCGGRQNTDLEIGRRAVGADPVGSERFSGKREEGYSWYADREECLPRYCEEVRDVRTRSLGKKPYRGSL